MDEVIERLLRVPETPPAATAPGSAGETDLTRDGAPPDAKDNGAGTEQPGVDAGADDAAVEAPIELESSAAPEDKSETLVRLEVTAEVVESLALGYHLGAALERIIAAAGQGSDGVQPLREAVWLLDRYAALLEERPVGADIHRTSVHLGRTGEALAELRAVSDALREQSAPDPAPTPCDKVSQGFAETTPPGSESETVPTETLEPPGHPEVSLARELGMTAFRWGLLVLAVVLVVLALTLIGDWHS